MIHEFYAAAFLGISIDEVRRLAAQGLLTPRRGGPNNEITYYDEAEIVRLKQRRDAQTRPPQVSLDQAIRAANSILKLVDTFARKEKKNRGVYDRALTIRGASAISGLSTSTLRKDIREGLLPAKKVNGEWRIRRSDFRKYFMKVWSRR
jgi:DNA-binding transcriptional MerR regulator